MQKDEKSMFNGLKNPEFNFMYSYCYEDEKGIFPEVEFAFDLELPNDFQPCVSDGEVHEFYRWPIDKVRNYLHYVICPG